MVYAHDIIVDSLTLINAIGIGEEPEADIVKIAVRTLNGMLGEWSSRGIYNPNMITVETQLTSGTNAITLGYGDTYYGTSVSAVSATQGTIPVNFSNILSVQLDLGTVTYSPKEISMEEYKAMSVKQSVSIPQYWAWDYQNPVSTIYLYPKAQSNLKFRIIGSPKFDSLKTSQEYMKIDDMYYSACVFNLATSLYPFFPREGGIDQELVYKARASMVGLRGKVSAMKGKKVVCPYVGSTHGAQDYWTSPFNTIG